VASNICQDLTDRSSRITIGKRPDTKGRPDTGDRQDISDRPRKRKAKSAKAKAEKAEKPYRSPIKLDPKVGWSRLTVSKPSFLEWNATRLMHLERANGVSSHGSSELQVDSIKPVLKGPTIEPLI
jgi:hypothetical protein